MPEIPYSPIRRALRAFIRDQYAANADLTLAQIYDHDYAGYRVHPELLAFVGEQRPAVRHILELEQRRAGGSLERLFVATTRARIYHNYQFLRFSAGDQLQLRTIYRDYLAGMAGALATPGRPAEIGDRLRAAILEHFAALQGFVAGLVAVQGRGPIAAPAVCEEYPPRLQLELLGIDLATLRGPILDVGCGSRGHLVRALRAAGYAAFGIDRSVAPAEGFIAADWLSFPLRPATWGAIISHMAFSNHFIFQHLHSRAAPAAYARKFMEILAALQPGGALYYSPGLPFIEQFLAPAEYSVTRRPVAAPPAWGARYAGAYADLLGGTPLYATQIVRRSRAAR
jgi:SAM-dependent methyltransferase